VNKKSNESPVNIAELFQSFDETSKEQNAILIYQVVAPRLVAPDWGMAMHKSFVVDHQIEKKSLPFVATSTSSGSSGNISRCLMRPVKKCTVPL
jgi:hypothetical protein